MYWIPLVALLVSSLGLVALKRVSGLPPWLERVAALPFYFVSFPIAALIIAAEQLAWGVRRLILNPDLGPYLFGLLWSFFWVDSLFEIVFPLTLATVLLEPFVVLLASGYLLWWTVRSDDPRKIPSNWARQTLLALILLFVFAWAFLAIRNAAFWLRTSHSAI